MTASSAGRTLYPVRVPSEVLIFYEYSIYNKDFKKLKKKEENIRSMAKFFSSEKKCHGSFCCNGCMDESREENSHSHFHIMYSDPSFINASQLVTLNLTNIPFLWEEEEREGGESSYCFLPAVLISLNLYRND